MKPDCLRPCGSWLRTGAAWAVVLAAAAAADAAPTIVHQPPMEAKLGLPVTIAATVTDRESRVGEVRLFYRSGGSLGYQSLSLRGAGYTYQAEIPGEAVAAAGVDYYLEARNQRGERSTWPLMSAATAPQHLAARAAAGAPRLRLVSPEVGAVLIPAEVLVMVALDPGAGRTDMSSIRIVFDDQDVTGRAEISETLITYAPPEDLADGPHNLRVAVRNTDGAEARSPTWSFTVSRRAPVQYAAEPTPKPTAVPAVRLSGTLGVDTQYAAVGGDPAQRAYLYQPEGFLNRLNLDLEGSLGDLNLSGSVYLTSEETPGRQPVNRLRLEVYDRAFRVLVGDDYPVFSIYSLDNYFVRGGGLTLTSGSAGGALSRFRVLGGLTKVPVEGRDVTAPGTYEQWLLASRWRHDFLDETGFALNYVTVNDYASSIASHDWVDSASSHVATGEVQAKIRWAERLATRLYGEYGLSLYDEAHDLLTISQGDAYRGGMKWAWGGGSYLRLEYRHTGSNYVSLASPWLIGDWDGLEGDALIALAGDALVLTLSGNTWHDNLDHQKDSVFYVEAAGATVTAGTTNSTYLSGQLSWRAAAVLPSLNLGYSLSRQQDDSTPDPIVDNQTTVLSLGLGTQLPVGADQLLGNLNYSQTEYADLAATRISADMSSSSLLLSLMYLLGREWSFTAGLGLTSNRIQYAQLAAAGLAGVLTEDQNLDYVLANLRATWKLLPGRLDLGASWDLMSGRDNLDAVENSTTTLGVSGTYYFTSTQSLGCQLSYVGYADTLADENSYTEFILGLRYGLGF